jgi:hypothetical protein
MTYKEYAKGLQKNVASKYKLLIKAEESYLETPNRESKEYYNSCYID